MDFVLTKEEYDDRKHFLDNLKNLSKTEHEHILKILKTEDAKFSENSNGVFFDVSTITSELFLKLQTYMNFCMEVNKEQKIREDNERKAHEMLR
jgi:hypothetical protein